MMWEGATLPAFFLLSNLTKKKQYALRFNKSLLTQSPAPLELMAAVL